MYQSYYGFKEMPFNITPDPKFLYLSPTHQEALQHLKFGVMERKGFIVLVGEVGCGKTTICRRFLNELDPARFDTALILNPRVTETQMLKQILTELGEHKLARSQNDLVAQMNQVLLERVNRGRDVVLIIDEAQNLSFEVLEQIRLLSNIETDKQKLLQIVLMGPRGAPPAAPARPRPLRAQPPLALGRDPLCPAPALPRRRHGPAGLHPVGPPRHPQGEPRNPAHRQQPLRQSHPFRLYP
jgi:nucleoside-triphosphatase THEP1